VSDQSEQPSSPTGALFPDLPGQLLGDAAPCPEVGDFLERVRTWREAARAWLGSAAAVEAPITDEMRRILRAALGDPAAPAGALGAARTYRVGPFPAAAPPAVAERTNGDCKDARRYLLDVMVWRSRLVDFLSDVWDVIGAPLLDMDECEWVIRELLMPRSPARLCINCLQPMPSPDFERRHYDACVVRIARGDRTDGPF
jgi:hypothetical protein